MNISNSLRNKRSEHIEGKAYGAQQPKHILIYVAGASTAQHRHQNAQQLVAKLRN